MQPNILLVDDEKSILKILSLVLESAGFKVEAVSLFEEALNKLNTNIYDLVISDLMLDKKNAGIDILKYVKQISPETEIIIMTGYASVENAIESIKSGAYHYLQKPINNDELITFIKRALEHKNLVKENLQLKERLEDKVSFHKIIGKSKLITEAIRLAKIAASVESPVLITGKTGTGKELFAQAIHNASPKKNKPFVAINCAAIPENLLESELFGYVKGAFTGAANNHQGLFETANEGTILLDEIGEMPLLLQSKILRFLQDFEIRRLGDTKLIKVKVRIIASTNKNLQIEIKEKKFREDLYYRLNVIKIALPSLNERQEDIPLLINYFSQKLGEKYNYPKITLSSKSLELLANYNYAGNIRELENLVERIIIFNQDQKGTINPKDIPFLSSEDKNLPKQINNPPTITSENTITLKETEANAEKIAIIKVIKQCNGNLNKTAESLKIGRTTLWRKMKKYNIDFSNMFSND